MEKAVLKLMFIKHRVRSRNLFFFYIFYELIHKRFSGRGGEVEQDNYYRMLLWGIEWDNSVGYCGITLWGNLPVGGDLELDELDDV